MKKAVMFKHGLLAGLLLAATVAAHADGVRTAPTLKLYQQECAACHMAYPPGLLPQSSWQRLMGSLDQHFGVDASLDDASVKTLSNYLMTHAGRGRKSSEPPNDRITQSEWFVRKHRGLSSQDLAHPKVKSAANCMACHAGAEQGDFEEDRVRLPQGVGAWGGLWGAHDD